MKISRYKTFLAVCDFIFINISLLLSLQLRFGISHIYSHFFHYFLISIVFSLYVLDTFEYHQMYKYQTFTNFKYHITKLSRCLLVETLLGIIFCTFLFKLGSEFESRAFILSFILIAYFIFLIYRVFLFSNVFLWLQKIGWYKRNLVIYGAGLRGKQSYQEILKGDHWRFLGFIDDNKKKNKKEHILGNFYRLKGLTDHKLVDTIIVAIDNISQEHLLELLNMLILLDLHIFIISENYQILNKTQPLEIVDGLELIEFKYNSKNFYQNFIKRLIDIIGSVIGLLILSPFFLILSIIIKLTSKGPVFYKQIRIGENGKTFKFYKFRSMYINNKAVDHQKFVTDFIKGKTENGVQKITKDPRITPIGHFIRKTSIDELPQLFNVLKGEMSLVGPRPCLPYEYKEYKNWHRSRFLIKPGCTGVWQVSGRSKVSFEEMVVMDYYYIHNISPWLDAKLILKTIPVMTFGIGGF